MRRKPKPSRQQNLVERVIWWIATKPWVFSRDGNTKAYHTTMDPEEVEKFRRFFNDAAEVIDQHYSGFGMRLTWGFTERHGEQVKAIHLNGGSMMGWLLLDWLEFTNATLTRKPPSQILDDERLLRMRVRDKINIAVARWKKRLRKHPEEPAPFLISGHKKLNYRPDAPPEPARETYGPVDWQFMSDFLFLLRIPEKDFENQAKSQDGWWNRKGRKKVAFQNIRSRIAPFS